MSVANVQAEFSCNLLQQIVNASAESTIAFSPVSVAFVLSMIYFGAKNETADELRHVLGGSQNSDEIQQYFVELMGQLKVQNENYTLSTVNEAYINESYKLLYEFRSKITHSYGSHFESVNFNKPVETANEINDFVTNNTHGKITDFLSANDVDGQTRLVLINAIYFKGAWRDKFDANLTTNEPFYVTPEEEKMVATMHRNAEGIAYYENTEMNAIKLPYAGDEVSALIILPTERGGFNKFVRRFDATKLKKILDESVELNVNISLPSFRIESDLEMNKALLNLGLQTTFTSAADFSGISSEPLYVDTIRQKTFIQTDEEGSEAAAATFAGIRLLSYTEQKQFHANHPFLFLLINSDNTVLFSAVIRMEQ